MNGDLRAGWRQAWSSLDQLRMPHGYQASESQGGLYPAIFGRDSLWLALLLLESLDHTMDPRTHARVRETVEWALTPLVQRQATSTLDEVEAQPGKVFHAYWPQPPTDPRTGILPLVDGTTFCGFDQTFLLVVAAARFARRFPHGAFRGRLIAAARNGVGWMLRADRHPHAGLYAYRRRNLANPIHQVWKDSFDCITHGGFDIPPGPLAWIDVQGYAHAALRAAAWIERDDRAGAIHDPGRLEQLARELRTRADRALWWAEEDCYPVALDGDNVPVCMVTSIAGHALWGALPSPERAATIASRLTAGDMLTGYGLRTLSARDRFFESDAYHRGTVWPFDNAVTVAGLLRFGLSDDAMLIAGRVVRALALIGSPVELYAVTPHQALVHPPLVAPDQGELLLHRRTPPQNLVQAFSVAGQIFMLAFIAARTGVDLDAPP
ncbi:MAG TPA: hypothetical protein VGQ92_10615 [Actinoplanes sp.]|nr:hypothetical protein [Actinoplanes sp.]